MSDVLTKTGNTLNKPAAFTDPWARGAGVAHALLIPNAHPKCVAFLPPGRLHLLAVWMSLTGDWEPQSQ
jgi:hypothetical protein